MHGYIYIVFPDEKVGIDEANAPPGETNDLLRWSAIVAKSRLAHLKPELRAYGDGQVAPAVKGETIARIQLALDISKGTLLGERDYDRFDPTRVELYCWVSARPADATGGLTPGMWKDDDSFAGVCVTRSPSKNDPNRMLIIIEAKTLGGTRATLLRVLTGETRPSNPWII